MDLRLISVTKSGSVDDLYTVIELEPRILDNFDVLTFIDTPLHEASSAGYIDMAMELMILKPSFAKKLNAEGFSPLHLAVQNNLVELALELIKCDPNLIRFPGKRGMTPFHLVAEKDNVDLLTEFLLACPESIRDVNVNGETALHITVINNRCDQLKVLTGWMQRNRSRDASSTEIHVLNRCDRGGNTALHLAARKNNYEAVKQLLRCMSLNRNIVNKSGLTALDVLHANGSLMSRDIEKSIQNSGGKTKDSLESKVKNTSYSLSTPVNFWGFCSTAMARYRSNVSDGSRNALLVITALIITATYQTAVQPEDRDEIDREKDIINWIVLLWGFNTTAYGLSILSTSILLPVGRAYTCWYVVIIIPLSCSFGLSAYRKYDMYDIDINDIKNMLINTYVIIALGFLVYLLEFYVRWKRNRPKRVFDPKHGKLFKGFNMWVRH